MNGSNQSTPDLNRARQKIGQLLASQGINPTAELIDEYLDMMIRLKDPERQQSSSRPREARAALSTAGAAPPAKSTQPAPVHPVVVPEPGQAPQLSEEAVSRYLASLGLKPSPELVGEYMFFMKRAAEHPEMAAPLQNQIRLKDIMPRLPMARANPALYSGLKQSGRDPAESGGPGPELLALLELPAEKAAMAIAKTLRDQGVRPTRELVNEYLDYLRRWAARC